MKTKCMTDLRDKLNPSQLQAVTTTDGPLLVIAGAGSGKTRVIEYRVLHLLQNGVHPEAILLLTFTRRAAKEMLSRSSRHAGRAKYVDGGTFHSFAYKVIKRYSAAAGVSPVFTVMDEDDSIRAVQDCLSKFDTLGKDKRFPKKDTLRRIISMCVNKQACVEDLLSGFYPQFSGFSSEIDLLRRQYAEYKAAASLLDYDDLLVCLKLLLEKEEIRIKVSQQYRYIMVDEYQDTNKLQGEIAFLLAKEHGNIMVVGDDAQSIYGFRGASHENIMAFPKMFKECRIIALEENYRSTQPILDMANAVLDNMRDKYCKRLFSAGKVDGERPNLQVFSDTYEEARWIAGKIQELQYQGMPFSRQGVLFRSEYVSIPLQAELTKRGIQYQIFGGLKFYETAHVKDVLAYLRLLVNPKDTLAWGRILMLVDGIGPRTAEQIVREIAAAASSKSMLKRGLAKYTESPKYGAELKNLLEVLANAGDSAFTSLDKFEAIMDYYHPILMSRFDDWNMRSNDLDAFKEIFERSVSLEELLVELAIESPQKNSAKGVARESRQDNMLTLSTVHSAKGLEWEAVFLLGLADGVLPVSFALNDENDIEEEHRIFYVGITRARRYLFLSMPQESARCGRSQINKISRFLSAAPVLSKIEHGVIMDYSDNARFSDEFEPVGKSLSDKRELYKRLMDFL